MIRTILVAVALLCALAPTAEARRAPATHPDCNRLWPCDFGSNFLAGMDTITVRMTREGTTRKAYKNRHSAHFQAVESITPYNTNWASAVSMPSRYIAGRLVCAINVGQALAERGIRGTGSALAKSYLGWGRPSGPEPGAVAVFNRGRGGHVAFVHHVEPDGTVHYLNPSSRRHAWQVGPYNRRPIAFRMATNG